MNALFPVSIKGVLFRDGKVVLLKNERDEWELPGGRPEVGETPDTCLMREFREELGVSISVGTLLDRWMYDVMPGRRVQIITYAVTAGHGALRVSPEHQEFGLFTHADLGGLRMPSGYLRSIVRAIGLAGATSRHPA